MKYQQEMITLSIEEWWQVEDDRAELKKLREFKKEQDEANREYLKWSLSGGMFKAVMAGFELGVAGG